MQGTWRGTVVGTPARPQRAAELRGGLGLMDSRWSWCDRPDFPGAGGSARWLGHEPLGLRSTGLPGFSAVGRRSAWLGHIPRRT